MKRLNKALLSLYLFTCQYNNVLVMLMSDIKRSSEVGENFISCTLDGLQMGRGLSCYCLHYLRLVLYGTLLANCCISETILCCIELNYVL